MLQDERFFYTMEESKLISLAMSARNKELTVSQIIGGRQIRQKLADLGIIPGTRVSIVSNNLIGPIILAVKNYRLAIGRGLATKIMVSDQTPR